MKFEWTGSSRARGDLDTLLAFAKTLIVHDIGCSDAQIDGKFSSYLVSTAYSGVFFFDEVDETETLFVPREQDLEDDDE